MSQAERPRNYDTFMHCEECSSMIGKNMFFCNNTKMGTPVLCHVAYHNEFHNRKYTETEEDDNELLYYFLDVMLCYSSALPVRVCESHRTHF